MGRKLAGGELSRIPRAAQQIILHEQGTIINSIGWQPFRVPASVCLFYGAVIVAMKQGG